ncbi:antitoxin Xre/MbcA/ParS toxin-binding domain-containing protein [Phenylobacterium sp.]|uniref:antitoxin Xre/MbcA/ParS toxin-binding domain-containing protein n=1 Tax=Phenylobacterium sp. TaxID=1871053 RepID=UPI0025D9A681|nr:antitoxin Xre/MbcA/ParS toxin-binding domain-containing protein [Phenylobacterium sp.]
MRSVAKKLEPVARRPRVAKGVPPRFPARLSIASLMDATGAVRVDEVADAFSMTKAQLAETAGLAREVFQKASRRDGPKAQSRVREMLEIISLVQGWAGGPAQAMAWYRAEPIPAFGGRTAEALVKSGSAGAVRDYVDHLATGGYA